MVPPGNPPNKARVVLVDDHPAVLHQVKQILPERFQVLATFENALDALSAIPKAHADILILDINLPSMNGFDLVRHLPAVGQPSKIVFMTAHPDPDYLSEGFELGALGHVIKPRLTVDLVPALDAALAGHRFVSPCDEFARMH